MIHNKQHYFFPQTVETNESLSYRSKNISRQSAKISELIKD